MTTKEYRAAHVVDVDGKLHCAYGTPDEAKALAEKAGGTTTGETTGYPFRPRLDEHDHLDHYAGGLPSFCTSPRRCKSERGGSCVNPGGRSCTS